MITKQQAIEFIDELSKNHKIFMDLEHGKFYVNTYITIDEDILGDYGFEKGGFLPLEIAVWLFIKENINTDLLKEFKQIPVDVDMLEIGQTYRLGTGETLHLIDITEYKLIFTHTKNNIVFGIDKEDIKEIYKVQNDN